MKYIISLMIVGFFPFTSVAGPTQSVYVDSETSIKTWQIKEQGVHLSLTQILPEQLQAFYLNRGFTLTQIEPYVTSCVYMAVLRNDHAPGAIHYVSNDWSVLVKNKPRKLRSIDQWLERLSKVKPKKSALIAFRWAQFPIEQSYEPGGDWNQGMLSIGLTPGSVFDLIAYWDVNGKAYQTKLQGVRCAQ
jgi:hypothetical protein